ncbi:MAG: hypothetical protein KAQ94_09985, partial [Arcobacteraceae bacterium]|nr:hypothetical protein [Arcobacteraceae bacterium]
TGAGNDTVSSDDIRSGSTVDTGAGDDTVTVTDDVHSSTVSTGDGADRVTIGDDITASTVNTGAGNDTVSSDDITASTVNTGAGDDTVTVTDDVHSSTVSTGDGDDRVTIGDDIRSDSIVNTGAGNDTVTVGDDVRHGATINTGDGDDTVTVGDGLESTSSIDTGDGDDTVDVNRIMEDATIDTGEGDDTVTLDDVSSGFDDGSVKLGTGDDTLTIDDSLRGTDATFDGGEGTDSLVLNDVDLDAWNDGISDNFINFENVTLSDGSTIDLTDDTATAPTLDMSIGDAVVNADSSDDDSQHANNGYGNGDQDAPGNSFFNNNAENATETFQDGQNHNFNNSGDSHTYNFGGDTNSVDIEIAGYKDSKEEGRIILTKDGEVVDIIELDDATTGGNNQHHTFTVSSDSAFDSIEIVSDSNRNFTIKNVEADIQVGDSEVSTSYDYPITLNAGLTDTDGSEELGDITLNNLPEDATLTDANGDEISANDDGSYTVATDENGDASVTLTSSSEIESSDLNSITASVTSTDTDGNDISTVAVNDSGDIDASGSVSDDGEFTFDADNMDLNFDNVIVDESTEINSIDMSDGNHDITNLELADVLDMTGEDNVLTILGDDTDSVQLENTNDDTWTQAEGTTEVDGHTFVTFTSSDATILIENDVPVTMG